MSSMTSTAHVEFHSGLEVLEALQVTALVLPATLTRPLLWKTTICSLHAGVRSTLILALSDENGLGALDDRSTKQTLEWLISTERGEREGFPPIRRHASFAELVQRAMREIRPQTAIPLTLWPSQRRDLEVLDRSVELFKTRFAPAPFLMDTWALPQVINTGLQVVEQLMGPNSWARRSLEPSEGAALDAAVSAIRTGLQDLETAAQPPPTNVSPLTAPGSPVLQGREDVSDHEEQSEPA